MALRFNTPESFNFENLLEWPEFQEATQLGKETKSVQISSLTYEMDKEAEHVFKLFVLNDQENAKTSEPVLMKVDEYFLPKRNVLSFISVGKTQVKMLNVFLGIYMRLQKLIVILSKG